MKIRPIEDDDRALIFKWLDSPEVLRYFPIQTRAEIEDAVRIWYSYKKLDAAYTLTTEDGKSVGSCVLYRSPFKKYHHRCLFAIVLDPDYRGQGHGYYFIQEIEKIAKDKLGIEILHLEVYEGNRAINLYHKLGYQQYGVHKDFLHDPSGDYLDKIVMEKRL